MSHVQYVDELVKEYLLFRGFSQTLRTLENDLKIDKDKGFRVDRLTDQIVGHIQTYDLPGLRELWGHLDKRLFVRLSPSLQPYVRKLETSVLRLYVVNTIQTNKPDKLVDFFDKMASDLQTQQEWKDWFVLPYLRGAEDSPVFAMYFTRQWQDTLLVSLTNFLAIIFQSLSMPTLARYSEESRQINKLQEENLHLRVRLNAAINSTPSSAQGGGGGLSEMLRQPGPLPEPPHPAHLMDDFYNIAQEASMSSEGQLRSFKNLLFGFGGGGGGGQQAGGAGERGRQHSQPSQQGGPEMRRTSSQAPPTDRRRGRSSSLATGRSVASEDRTNLGGGGSSNKPEHPPVKRLGQPGGGARRSRSPNRTDNKQQDGGASDRDSASMADAPFLVQQEVAVMGEQQSVVTCAVFSPSGAVLATGDTAGTVTLHSSVGNRWSSTVAGCSSSLRGTVAGLVWLGESERLLLAAAQPGLLALWDAQDQRLLWEAGPDTKPQLRDRRLMAARVSPTATSAILSVAPRVRSQQGGSGSPAPLPPPAILTMDIKTTQIETSHQLPSGCCANSCAVNHNGSLVVCGCSDGCVRIVDLRTPDVIATWPAHKGQVFSVSLSHHQDKLYTIGSDNKFSCWSLTQTGQKLLEQSLHRQAAGPFMVGAARSTGPGARSVLLRPYGALFALHDNDKYAFTCSPTGCKVYQVSGSEVSPVQEFGQHRSAVVTVDWAPHTDGRGGSCASASLDGCVNLATLRSTAAL